jgi:hypothetical protein
MLEASIGAPRRHAHLTLFPLVAQQERALPYHLLAHAVAAGRVSIQEVGQGTVPTLQVQNKGDTAVLILDGEQLLGARQNRMTNRSVLLAPGSATPIPVSCMEQGRWHFVSEEFQAAPQNAPARVRSKARQVEALVSEMRGHSSHRDLASAQGEVWAEIRSYGDKVGGASPTGALDAMYRHRQDDLEAYLRALPPVERQIGLLAFVGHRPLGLDALGSPGLYAPLHRRLLTGYVMDALAQRSGPDGYPLPGEPEALHFVGLLREARRTPSETVGLGEYRVLQGGVLGGELVHDGHLVHLSAFPLQEDAAASDGSARTHAGLPIQGPRSRRRVR